MTMRGAKVVIGANFGDEGKGLAVDALAARMARPLVVRFNGGAQAGHTVTAPDGRRHVFSHVGAGVFQAAPTFLSRFFIVHPGIFAREIAELAALGVRPKVLVDPDARVTTPYDVLINRWIEETRGGQRHGSVGIGFGETIERAEQGYPLAVRDLGDDDAVAAALERFRSIWLPLRLARLGIEYTAERAEAASAPQLLAGYLDELRAFRQAVVPAAIDLAVGGREVIFEGAQGLLLDQDRGFRFPHVTRSNTGLKNVLALAADVGIDHLDVTYMTRPYLTRHGAGPLENETARLAFAEVVDPTNRPNPWQGSLRFAPLDLVMLRATLAADLSDAEGTGIGVDAGLGVSCLDQVREAAEIRVGGSVLNVPPRRLAAAIADLAGVPAVLQGWGPTRQTVRFLPAPIRRKARRPDASANRTVPDGATDYVFA